jgi:predicted ABC-type ATPase
MPKFYIIAGCNGAGKTTASFEILPQILNCKEFVNADEIARGLSPFQPETVAIEAGRLMINRIQDLLSRNVDFAIETTLSSRSYVNTIKQAKSLGYETYLLYFWLSSPQMAVERVAKRVSQGGHHIPTDTIFRRYKLGIKYLFGLYLNYADNVMILDNSYKSTLLIANNQLGKEINIIDQEKFETLKSIANEK